MYVIDISKIKKLKKLRNFEYLVCCCLQGFNIEIVIFKIENIENLRISFCLFQLRIKKIF